MAVSTLRLLANGRIEIDGTDVLVKHVITLIVKVRAAV